jgi:hypothetical protein
MLTAITCCAGIADYGFRIPTAYPCNTTSKLTNEQPFKKRRMSKHHGVFWD